MRSTSSFLPVILVFGAAALPCRAQAPSERYPELLPGARVRVAAPGVLAGRYVGTVLSRASDTVVVANSAGAQIRVPFTSMTSLEISRGKSRMAGFKRGVIWGAPIGLGFGLLTTSSVDGTYQGDGQTWGRGEWVAYSIISGALWGGGIGALIGRERWDPYLQQSRVSIVPHGRAVQVGVAVGGR